MAAAPKPANSLNATPGPVDPAALREAIGAADNPVVPIMEARDRFRGYLDERFNRDDDIADVIQQRARFMDTLLGCIWDSIDWPDGDLALVAVGGYGRGELHPHSDVDLLILANADHPVLQERISQFIALLWDVKLNIGHSVRTVAECVEKAREDITVVTSLMESRLIRGSDRQFQAMRDAIESNQFWDSASFFRAKWDEQTNRHARFADTEYNLEPNVKSSPGGLRDLQTISWIALRHFGLGDPQALQKKGLLTEDEFDILINGRNFLWRVRYALHMITGRGEDRLLFDHQRELAGLFGYKDSDIRLAVEQFMQQYYRWALALGQLNEVLMQHFDQVILRADSPEQIVEIDARFQVRSGYIEGRSQDVFSKTPSALLEVFLHCARNESIEGVHVGAIRLIREHCGLIDDDFRNDPRNCRLFMDILRSTHKLTLQLRRMNRYGVLGAYLPEFGKVVGQMQHDLFHIYTVDAHTLEVIKNMRHFLLPENQESFPVPSRVARRLPKIELLYIAGLYHDIGKGRGGDHSELGAVDARLFCERHGIDKRDTDLVCWLVQNHLLMSQVAQRKDISDPGVIREFATAVGDQIHLDHLLALTVADINATNPTLWNAWRNALLHQLYIETRRALRRGLEHGFDTGEWIAQVQRKAMDQLEDRGFIDEEVETLWESVGEDYFLREQVEDIVWHTESIARHFDKDIPLVLARPHLQLRSAGVTQIFIHVRSRDYLFAEIAAALEQLELSVHDARVYSSGDGMALDTFHVLDADGNSIAGDSDRLQYIIRYLSERMQDTSGHLRIEQRRTPRQIKAFSMPTETTMTTDPDRQMSVLEVVTPDRPGLLARIGRIFFEFDIYVQAAKITTLGERVEDVFFITTRDRQPITDKTLCTRIQKAVCEELDKQAAA